MSIEYSVYLSYNQKSQTKNHCIDNTVEMVILYLVGNSSTNNVISGLPCLPPDVTVWCVLLSYYANEITADENGCRLTAWPKHVSILLQKYTQIFAKREIHSDIQL